METLLLDQGAPGAAQGPEHRLGPDVSRRFDFQSWGHRGGRGAVRPASARIGSLAAQTDHFVAVIGRSLASRSMVGQRFVAQVGGTGRLPVRPPDEYFPVTGERQRFTVSPSETERRSRSFSEIQDRMTGARRRDHWSPPVGLPRVTARAGHTRVGRQTGPTGARGRMASQPAFVSNPREVSWSGRLVSGRDRLTVGTGNARAHPPPGPPSGELRAAAALGAPRTVAPFLSAGPGRLIAADTLSRARGSQVIEGASPISMTGYPTGGRTVGKFVANESSHRPSGRLGAFRAAARQNVSRSGTGLVRGATIRVQAIRSGQARSEAPASWSAGTWSAGTWSAGTWSAGTWSADAESAMTRRARTRPAVDDPAEPPVLARKPRSGNLTVAILTRTPVRPSVARLTVASGGAGGFTGAGSAGAGPSRALPRVTGPHIARQVGDNPFATNRGRASTVTASTVTASPVTASPTTASPVTASRVPVGQVPVRPFRAARGATSGPLGTHFSGTGVSTLPIGRPGLPGAILRTPGPAGPGRATATGFGTANHPLANIEIAERPWLLTAAAGVSAARAKAVRAPSRPADLGKQRAAPLAPGARRPTPKGGGAAISNNAFPSVAWPAVLTPHPLRGGLLRSPGPPIRPPASARSSPPAIAMEASGDTAVRLTSERQTVPLKTVPLKTVPLKTVPQKVVPLKTSALLPTGRRGPRSDVRSYGRRSGTVPFVMPRGTLAWLPLRKRATREGRLDVAGRRTSPVGATGLRSSSFSLSPTPTGLKSPRPRRPVSASQRAGF